jgi:hypothetical protein
VRSTLPKAFGTARGTDEGKSCFQAAIEQLAAAAGPAPSGTQPRSDVVKLRVHSDDFGVAEFVTVSDGYLLTQGSHARLCCFRSLRVVAVCQWRCHREHSIYAPYFVKFPNKNALCGLFFALVYTFTCLYRKNVWQGLSVVPAGTKWI